MKKITLFLLVPVILVASPQGGEVHKAKTAFKNFQQWNPVAPGQVTLKNFTPFRAVYQRTYRQGAGPKAGEPRTDRVIITAEDVGWDGRPAILFNMIDSAEAHYDDTNGRTFSMYFDKQNMAVLLELGPVPGKGKDYYAMRVLKDKVVATMVTTDQGVSEKREIPVSVPGFGAPAPWLLASLDLEKDQKIRFAPAFSIGLGAFSAKAPFRVVGKERVKSVNGTTSEAWILESIANLTSPWVTQNAIIDKPPYLIRRVSINHDSGEKKTSLELIDFQAFPR